MEIKFVVTTRLSVVKTLQSEGYSIIMVDGTVPGFVARPCDLHFDHHRDGGADIQLDEINAKTVQSLFSDKEKVVFVTTQVDADACVAGAFCSILQKLEEKKYLPIWSHMPKNWKKQLNAIAYDCDHLYVPSELSEYADFAAQCVAAMKAESNELVSELGLNPNRREWTVENKELFASTAFERGTQHLVDACLGKRPFPGENGEAKEYWEKVESFTQQLKEENRVYSYNDAVIIDMKGLVGQYVDPRCALRVVQGWGNQPKTPITITQREIYSEGEFKGYSYTLGCIPWHPELESLDYCKGVYDALTMAEVAKGGDPEINKWGGRKTVGGSGWNAVSFLSPEDVIDTVKTALNPTAPVVAQAV